MAPNTQADRRLMKKYNIVFEGPIDSVDVGKLPESCEIIFQHLQELGKTEFDQFRLNIGAHLLHHPWLEQVQRRATRISELAKRCLLSRKNEDGWRMSLENEILARFAGEVACPKCRARLWRSALEVKHINKDSFLSQALVDRQQNRKACSCNLRGTGTRDDIYENRMNQIFDDRVSEGIIYPPQLLSDMSRREQKPDRVYGLVRTKRLERLLLGSQDKRSCAESKTIGDNLKSSPFRSDGEPIVFPFLVLEAKSEKGKDSFSDIEVQTAFAIRELLLIQAGLKRAAEDTAEWEGGPLVWFLSNKGQHWKVCAACIDERNATHSYRVFQIWNGEVNSKSAALQLLLIIDYIVDWARDTYREAVIQSLRKLAANDSRSLAYDSAVFSIAHDVQTWSAGCDEAADHGPGKSEKTLRDLLGEFDSRYGVIRDVRYIRSRFISLFVTEDNFSVLIGTKTSKEECKKLAVSILTILKEAWRVKRDALDSLEANWTGKDRDGWDLYPPDKVFLVVATVTAYLSPAWEQTRELSYLAVSETLIDSLLETAGMKREKGMSTGDFPQGQQGLENFGMFFQNTAQTNLRLCVSRVCIMTGISAPSARARKSREETHQMHFASTERLEDGLRIWVDAVVKPAPLSKARELVYHLYEVHKAGRNEPTSSLFRTSTTLDELGPPKIVEKRPGILPSAVIWPSLPECPDLADYKAVFAVSGEPGTDAQVCLFILDPEVVTDGLQPDKLREYCPDWHFRAKRFDRRPVWSRGWNLKQVVGEDDDFTAHIDQFFEHLLTAEHRALGPNGSPNDFQAVERTWGPKTATKWHMFTHESQSFNIADAFNFAAGAPHRQRISSITWRGHRRTCTIDKETREVQRDEVPDPLTETPELHRRASLKGKSPVRANVPSSNQEATGPSSSKRKRVIRVDSEEPMEGEASSSTTPPKRLRPGSERLSTRDCVDDTEPMEGEASSSTTPPKRLQPGPEQLFTRDYVDDEELEKLIRDGVFS